jgi:hypothetical protein
MISMFFKQNFRQEGFCRESCGCYSNSRSTFIVGLGNSFLLEGDLA